LGELLQLFVNNLLPVFLASGAGYLASRFFKLDVRTVSNLVFYIFSPCLIFSLLTHSQLGNSEIFGIMLFASAVMALVGLFAGLLSVAFRLERRMIAAVVVASMFMNAGIYGLPVVLFAFGETAMGIASVFFVTSAALSYTLGVFIASSGSASLGKSLKNLLQIPTVYALLAAWLFVQTGWELPVALDRTATLLGNASIPGMLILLGLQFRNIHLKGIFKPLSIALSARLLISPMIALLLAAFFRLSGPARQAGVLEASMPTAVLTTVLATQFDAEPAFVSTVVVVSTLISPLTLTPLLAYLGA
jgi:malate permease and related proteins